MSGSLKSALQKQYKAAIGRWPKDDLRPDVQLPDILSKHLADRLAGRSLARPILRPSGSLVDGKDAAALSAVAPAPPSDLQQLRQINALFSLLDDRYKKANRITGTLMTPRSNPTYYTDLVTELQEAPKRSLLGRISKRLGGMFRLS
ncbi:hypothetical protein CMQ_557 [Grosmannia clavigera kw1407]|uniref:Uncharacterized protein n=1 Tax=Grosmannia clavigera (strain kw1407 / UAMH 11150) TaxID=655863 RepID=F0XF39_GROCL|nr:uncharacterized protein CMQ_557 [Grosmannia clavigera kw1407]EFX03629.1 hypothetical protein CMQ_557 [Grosmannia clavigera kw1407]